MGGQRILVIEDNDISRKMVRVALEREGYAVLEAPDGRRALELIAQGAPDLIIQDLILPDVDGIKLVERIRSLPGCAELPILAVSGFLSKMEQARSLQVGFTDYLFKPIEPSLLLQVIRAQLSRTGPVLERPGQGLRVLVVDDDPVQRKLLTLHLTDAGFRVTVAAHGGEALDQASQSRPDVILSDVMMPHLDGFQLCMNVRQNPRLAGVPVVLISSVYLEEADRHLAQDVGASALITRDSDLKDIVETLLVAVRGELTPVVSPLHLPPQEEYVYRLVRQLEKQVRANQTLAGRLATQRAQLSILSATAETIIDERPIEAILREMLHRCLNAAGVSKGALYLLGEGGNLYTGALLGYPDLPGEGHLVFFGCEDLLRQAMGDGKTLTVPSVAVPEDTAQELLARAETSSMLLIPIKWGERQLGVLYLASGSRGLTDDWVEFADTMATQIAQAIVHARAFTRLKVSEARFRSLGSCSPIGIFLTDAEGRCTYTNTRCQQIYDLAMEQMLEDRWTRGLHPEDRESVAREWDACVRESRDFSREFRVLRPGGGMLWVHARSSALRTDTGDQIGYVGTIEDITSRKHAEDQLRLQGAALESAANAILITDREGRITWVNPAFTSLTGYPSEEVLGQNPRLLNSGKQDRSFYQHLWETILSGQVWRGENINRRKDGSLYTEEQTITPLRNERGEITHFISIKLDITERKQAEMTRQALYRASLQIQEPLAQRERLGRLLETVHEILQLDRVNILLSDPEERWLEAVACHGVEEPLESIRIPIGPAGGALAHAFRTQQAVLWDGRSRVPAPFRLQPPFDQIKALRSKAFVALPLVVQGRSIGVLAADRRQSHQPLDTAMQEMLQLFVTHAALAIEQARLYDAQRMAAIQLEATVEARTRDLQEAMHQLEASSRHKSEFLANMSHELRTPLNSVIGFSELLLERTVGQLNEKQTRFLTNIQNSGKHLVQLISDILDLSKVEAGKVVLQVEPLPVAMTLEDILFIVRGLAHKKRQTVETQIYPDLPPLQADPVRFKQILFNLLSNAIKFTPDGGSVTVTAKRVRGAESGVRSGIDSTSHVARRTSDPGEFVEIAVQDTGIGIKAEDLPRLFQEFMQLEAAATKCYEGTGLGLALTRRLVELHGGRIWAESAGEGRGSTFTFALPFAGPGETADASEGAPT